MRKQIIKRPSAGRRRSGGGGAAQLFGMILIFGLIGVACQGTAEASESTPTLALCSTDSDCEARGFDGYYGDPCDSACEAGASYDLTHEDTSDPAPSGGAIAPFAAVNGNAYVARLLSEAQQVEWLRALHGDDMPVICKTFNRADPSKSFVVCSPRIDNDGSPMVGEVEEDGAARYADGSEYDPQTATWN